MVHTRDEIFHDIEIRFQVLMVTKKSRCIKITGEFDDLLERDVLQNFSGGDVIIARTFPSR